MSAKRATTEIDVDAWRSAIRADTFANYHAEMGRAVQREGNLGVAIEHYRRALSHDPCRRAVQVRLVDALRRSDSTDEAARVHRAAFALDPLYESRGYCLIGLDAFDEKALEAADEAFAEAERLAPESPEAPFRRRLSALARGRGEGCDAPVPPATGVVSEVGNRLTNALLSMAGDASREGRVEIAIEAARLVLALDPENREANEELGRGLVRLGRREEADRAFELARDETGYERVDSLLAHAECLTRLPGRFDRAGELLERAVTLDPDSPQVRGILSTFLQQRGRFDEAARSDREFLERQPAFEAAVRPRVALAVLAAGRPEEALEEFRRCPSKNDDPHTPTYRSLVHLALGDVPAAISALETATRIMPDDPWIAGYRALARIDEGDREGALARLIPLTETAPSIWSWMNLGIALAENGRREEALEAHRRSIEADPFVVFYTAHRLTRHLPGLLDAYRFLGFTSSPVWPRGV